MISRTPPWLQSILEEHFEELQMLWELRQSAVSDADYDALGLAELDERIEAHTDGLLLGQAHVRGLLEDGLTGEDPVLVFGAAYVLLRIGDAEAAQTVCSAIQSAEIDEQFRGLTDALCFGPIDLIAENLRQLTKSEDERVSLLCATARAFHRDISPNDSCIPKLLNSDDSTIRANAWRLVAILGA